LFCELLDLHRLHIAQLRNIHVATCAATATPPITNTKMTHTSLTTFASTPKYSPISPHRDSRSFLTVSSACSSAPRAPARGSTFAVLLNIAMGTTSITHVPYLGSALAITSQPTDGSGQHAQVGRTTVARLMPQ
jgi:hypothetical protein